MAEIGAYINGLTAETTPDTSADYLLIRDATDGGMKKISPAELVGELGGTLNDYICIIDQKTQNTAGGTFTSGAWRTRDLNTEQSDAGGHASVASNQITLAAGTYIVKASCPAVYVDSHQARLYDITNTALLLTGTSDVTGSGLATVFCTRSLIAGKITLAGSTVIEVQHYCQTTRNTNGLGVAANFGVEVYTVAEFWKVA